MLNPVLDLKRRDSQKLPHVVGHQYQPFAAGMRGNMQIVHTDGLSGAFELGSDRAVMLRGLHGIWQSVAWSNRCS